MNYIGIEIYLVFILEFGSKRYLLNRSQRARGN